MFTWSAACLVIGGNRISVDIINARAETPIHDARVVIRMLIADC